MIRKLTIILLSGVICLIGVTSALAAKYNESPMLRTRVAAGELPPVDERLPKNPVVVKVENQIGEYGGTFRTAVASHHRAYGSMLAGRFIDGAPFTFDRGGKMLPNWVEEGSLSDDGLTYTVRLREGIKWSDGVPVTTDDLIFTYEDVARNEEIFPAGVSWLRDIELEVVDEDELIFHLPQPIPLFAYAFQGGGIRYQNLFPKHYLKQFHVKYAPKEELVKAAKEAGVDTWSEYFDIKLSNENPERPNLHLWVLKEASTMYAILERNPYYWKVDEKGNQLPYIDRMRIDILASPDVYVMRGMGGAYDMLFYGVKMSDYPTLKANEEAGGYQMYGWLSAEGKAYVKFNLNYKGDEAIGELLRMPDFKKALAYAINREEVNFLVYLGQGSPVTVSPPIGSAIYKEEYAKMFSYDPAKAKEILDEINIVDTDGDGWREMPNGEKLVLEANVSLAEPNLVSTAELTREYWEDVGVQVRLNAMSMDRRMALDNSGMFQTSFNDLDITLYPLYFRMDWGPMGPFMSGGANYAQPDWEAWVYSNGEKGEKPSPEYLEAWDLFNDIMAERDLEKRKTLAQKLFENSYENVWNIGIIQEMAKPILVNNRLKNVPEYCLEAWPLRTPSNASIGQWYLEE